jgi:hypothetical protein
MDKADYRKGIWELYAAEIEGEGMAARWLECKRPILAACRSRRFGVTISGAARLLDVRFRIDGR